MDDAAQEIVEQEIDVEPGDGTRMTGTLRQPANVAAEAPVVLCLSAMGVRASYYRPLAEALCRQGLIAVTVDLRGIGKSSVRASRSNDFGYREIVELDFPAAVATVREAHPSREIFLLGHSLGGQLGCLYAATTPEPPAGIVLVASCSVYYRGWPFPVSWGLFVFQSLAKLSSRLLGYFPGHRVGFGGREARRLTHDWARQGATGRYDVSGSDVDYEARLGESEIPIVAFSFSDDRYCTPRAVRHLLAKMPRATKTLHELKPGDLGSRRVGHFGWVKRSEQLAPRIGEWLRERSASSA